MEHRKEERKVEDQREGWRDWGIREKKERCRNQRGGRMWGADEVEGGSDDGWG